MRLVARDDPARLGPLYRRAAAFPWDSAIEADPILALDWALRGQDADAVAIATRLVAGDRMTRALRIRALDLICEVDAVAWPNVLEIHFRNEGDRYRETSRLPDPVVLHAALERLEGEPSSRVAGPILTVLGQTMLPESIVQRAIRLAGRLAPDEPRLRAALIDLVEEDWSRVMCPPVPVGQGNAVVLLETLATISPQDDEVRRAALRLATRCSFSFEAERSAVRDALRRVLGSSTAEDLDLWIEAVPSIDRVTQSEEFAEDVLGWVEALASKGDLDRDHLQSARDRLERNR